MLLTTCAALLKGSLANSASKMSPVPWNSMFYSAPAQKLSPLQLHFRPAVQIQNAVSMQAYWHNARLVGSMQIYVWHAVGDFKELEVWMDREWPECPRALRNALLPPSAIDQLELSPALPKDERMRRWRSSYGQELLFAAKQAVVSAQNLTGKKSFSA